MVAVLPPARLRLMSDTTYRQCFVLTCPLVSSRIVSWPDLACPLLSCHLPLPLPRLLVAQRPPGHHAGVQGLLQSCISCGFCIFNGVAIAALHALSAHSDTIKRVAIVDFDVHHGNGTQEIVQQLGQRHPHLKKDQIFFTSIHLCDPGFYPDSGQAPDLLSNVLNVPVPPLWRRPKITQRDQLEAAVAAGAAAAASGRTGGGTRSKRSHSRSSSTPSPVDGSASALLAEAAGSGDPSSASAATSLRATAAANSSAAAAAAVAAASGAAAGATAGTAIASAKASAAAPAATAATTAAAATAAAPAATAAKPPAVPAPVTANGSPRPLPGAPPADSGRLGFRKRVEERVLPALRAHCPDLILLSSGFDGGKHDVGNQGITKGHSGYFQPGLDLSAADFDWLTKQLMHVADICCDGKIVSVLEGGYGKWNRDAKKGGLISAPVGAPRRPTIDRDTLGRYATAHIAALCSST